MKTKEKEEAKRLRKKEGWSLGKIADHLGVAKSSVSKWVKDIQLTPEQVDNLEHRSKYAGQKKGSQVLKKKHCQLRKEYREEGRLKAKEKDFLHMAGCMLYWAEGWKKNNRHSVMFANSDADMNKFFVRFLQESLGVTPENIRIGINCYDDVYSVDEIEEYWSNQLGVKRENFVKTVTTKPSSSQWKRQGICPYGTCQVRVHDTRVIQHIYGAIQEYGQFTNREWD